MVDGEWDVTKGMVKKFFSAIKQKKEEKRQNKLNIQKQLDELENLIKPIIRDATKIIPHRKELIPEGTNLQNHFGGLPYFEKGKEWPVNKKGEKMGFVMQIFNTDGICLPPEIKLLQFFYDFEHIARRDEGWHVRIYENLNTENVVIMEHPTDEYYYSAAYCEIEFVPIKSLPDEDYLYDYSEEASSLSVRINGAHPMKKVKSNGRIYEQYTFNSYWHLIKKLNVEMMGDGSLLGGYAWPTQGDPTPEDKDFVMLFQIDSEDEAGLHWVDMGRVYAFYNPKTKEICFEIQFH